MIIRDAFSYVSIKTHVVNLHYISFYGEQSKIYKIPTVRVPQGEVRTTLYLVVKRTK